MFFVAHVNVFYHYILDYIIEHQHYPSFPFVCLNYNKSKMTMILLKQLTMNNVLILCRHWTKTMTKNSSSNNHNNNSNTIHIDTRIQAETHVRKSDINVRLNAQNFCYFSFKIIAKTIAWIVFFFFSIHAHLLHRLNISLKLPH